MNPTFTILGNTRTAIAFSFKSRATGLAAVSPFSEAAAAWSACGSDLGAAANADAIGATVAKLAIRLRRVRIIVFSPHCGVWVSSDQARLRRAAGSTRHGHARRSITVVK